MWQLEYWRSVLAMLMVLSLPIYDHRTIVWSIFDQNTKIFRKRENFGKDCYLMG